MLRKITFILIMSLLAISMFMKSNNGVIFEYPLKDYDGIKIPDDVKVFFVKNVSSLDGGILNKNNNPIWGVYNPLTKKITLLFDMSDERIKDTLRHELAHHYYYNLTEYEKKMVKSKYKNFCKNEKEFYAETIESYGYFDFD